MDYEQKYKEALERAKMYQEMTVLPAESMIETIFPELKESEDEKIRKMIINQMEGWHKAALENNAVQDIKDSADAITWLEKQGQKKCIDDLTQQEAMDIAVAKCFEQGEQKNVLDIEIPFGAKDSELHEVIYLIPEGFHAEIKGNEVIIKKGKQKSAWSEEDERAFHHVLSVLEEYGEEHLSKSKFVCNWLKSIKARMGGDKV